MINWVSVTSSAIRRIGYDSVNSLLHIDFHNSDHYASHYASETLFFEFCTAPSKGMFYHRYLEGRNQI